MKDKLKIITDNTVNDLLNEEVILPSNYFRCFDKHAKTLEIDLGSEKFEEEMSKLLVDEFNDINSYVNTAMQTIDEASQVTLNAQEAIKNNDENALKSLYKQIKDLQSELENITDNVYKDYLTKVYNKKWLYHKYLSKDVTYKNDAIVALIEVSDYEYITEKYNKLISNNLLIFISKYLKDKLKEEDLDFEISRYLTNRFLILLNEEDMFNIETVLKTVNNVLDGTTLKSNSGIIIKPRFNYSISKVNKDQAFMKSLETLLEKVSSKA